MMRKPPSKQPRLCATEVEIRRLLCRTHNLTSGHNFISEGGDSSDSSQQSSPGNDDMNLDNERGTRSAIRTGLVEVEQLLSDKDNILDGASEETFKHLHGWLILQIRAIPCLQLEETMALCRCLDHLYSRFECCFPAILSVQERREALQAVTGIFLNVISSLGYNDADSSQQSQPATDVVVLVRLTGRILRDGSDHDFSFEQLQELLLCMVKLGEKKLIRDHLIDFLRMLCTIKCHRTAKAAQMVLTVISSSPTTTSATKWPGLDCADEHEKLFYWKCLAENSASSVRILYDLLQNKNEIESLTQMAIDQKFEYVDQNSTRINCIAICAAGCISRVAKRRPLFGATRQALLRILLEASCKSVRARAIPGLAVCHKEDSLWPDLLQTTHDAKFVQRVISFLVEPCLVKSPDPLSTYQKHQAAMESAIDLLGDLLEHLTIQQLPDEADSSVVLRVDVPSLRDIMSIGSVLLECENWCVVERTITMLGNCLRQVGVRLLDDYPDLLGTLATFLACSFSTMATKKSILVLFNDLAHDDSNWHLGMARQSKFLDGLVAMSSSSAWEGTNDQGEHKDIALSLLLLLSQNTANRRVLAKHTGVLHVLIRAVRDLDQANVTTARQQTWLGSREEMKSKILVIAAAL
jgi:hypothetical protein